MRFIYLKMRKNLRFTETVSTSPQVPFSRGFSRIIFNTNSEKYIDDRFYSNEFKYERNLNKY